MIHSLKASARTMLVVGLTALASACAPPAPGEVLLRQLEEKQFLKYAGPNADRMRAEIKDKGWPAIFGDSGRVYGADGLTLAKGGVSKFIEKLRPFLEAQGVKIPELKDDLKQESYSLIVDGTPLPIWTKDDLTRELGAQPGITGGLAAARSFALVNKLLENARSPERAYAIYSGAALSVMFLTDDLLAVMKADPVAVPKFMPYRLTADFPFFGQPQQ
ncbi:MAG: hypothetical protein K1Y01_18850 [Vicinamibacteria bacterium]|nr:hypothetical protein [Vicinamibacteria bacterium]